MAHFRILKHDVWGGGLKLADLKGYDEDFLLGTGKSVADDYPSKVSFTVDKSAVTKPGPERPGREGKDKASTQLTDSLYNLNGLLVVSERMRALIAGMEKKVEFLPVTIKGFKEPYFITNCLDHVACLDLEKSKATMSRQGDVAKFVKKVVLRDKALDPKRALFQIKEFPSVFLVRDDLAQAFEDAKLTGLEVIEPKAYTAS